MEEIPVIIPATCFRGTNYCFNEELAMLQITVLDGQPSRRLKLIDEKGGTASVDKLILQQLSYPI